MNKLLSIKDMELQETNSISSQKENLLRVLEQTISNIPVFLYKENILKAVENDPVTIITADTGSGKTTLVPRFLYEEGYDVIVTQPRRFAASSVSKYVANQMGVKFGKEVGFKTGLNENCGLDTGLLYCTDGLQMIREITGKGNKGKKKVLVIDEVHEWNLNIEVLIAWVKKQIQEGLDIKVVIMSATLDASKLYDFFYDIGDKQSSKKDIIEIPGRLYPVDREYRNSDELIPIIMELVKEKRNILVFQPGKKEIRETIEKLIGIDAEILPLYGELSPEEQGKVFKHYDKPKIIISTNIAQTSVTIDDIDVVVDTGVERRVEKEEGIEGIYLKDTSQADCLQRLGRAGRCKAGKYILCSNKTFEERDSYTKPEIQRVILNQMYLRLASIGIDVDNFNFFHEPENKDREFMEARRALIALGAMKKNGKVTEIGKKISKLPVDIHTARMILEAIKNNCLVEVLQIAAVLQVGSLKERNNSSWEQQTQEKQSDLLAELDLYRIATDIYMKNYSDVLKKTKDSSKSLRVSKAITAKELKLKGIFPKHFFDTFDILNHLIKSLKHQGINVDFSKESNNRELILKSILSGMVDNIYHKGQANKLSYRELDNKSVLGIFPEWMVGLPLDIEFQNKYGNKGIVSLVTMCSKIEKDWLGEIAPHLLSKRSTGSYLRDKELSQVMEIKETIFNNLVLKTDNVQPVINQASENAFCMALYNQEIETPQIKEIIYHNKQVINRIKNFFLFSEAEETMNLSLQEILLYKKNILGKGIISSKEFLKKIGEGDIRFDEMKFKIEDFLSNEENIELLEFEESHPFEVKLNGKKYLFEYQKSRAGFEVKISMSTDNISNIDIYTFSDLEFKIGKKIEVYITDLGSEYGDFSKAKEFVTNKKKLEKKEKFLKENPGQKIEIKPFESLPTLPDKQVIDNEIGLIFYSYFSNTYYDGFVIRWTENKGDANYYNREAENYKINLERSIEDEAYNKNKIRTYKYIKGKIKELGIKDKLVLENLKLLDSFMDKNSLYHKDEKKILGLLDLIESDIKIIENQIVRESTPLDEMDEEEILIQYESNEQAIEAILLEYPNIVEEFQQYENLELELNQTMESIHKKRKVMDMVFDDAKAKKIKIQWNQLKQEKKDLQKKIRFLAKKLSYMKEAKERLDFFQKKQVEIDNFLK